MLTRTIGPITAYRRQPQPLHALVPGLAAVTGLAAYAGGFSLLSITALALAGALAGASLAITLWAQAWITLAEEGWRVEEPTP